MFWRRRVGEREKKKKAIERIDGALWCYMVSQHRVTVDILHNLRRVERNVVVGGKPVPVIMIRIFDPATAKKKGVIIDDFESLDSHPELILYQGYYEIGTDGVTNIRIEKK